MWVEFMSEKDRKQFDAALDAPPAHRAAAAGTAGAQDLMAVMRQHRAPASTAKRPSDPVVHKPRKEPTGGR
jgi:hypothetical protein